MNRNELFKHFNLNTIDEVTYINPLVVANRKFFNQPYEVGTDYRKQALDFVAKNKLPFQSECNSHYELFKRWVKIVCPYCNGETEVTDGGGSANYNSVNYRCKGCKAEISIGGPPNMISFEPKE